MKDHKKNNARTFRYSDEVAAILQQHNNDFDALVLECFYKLPEVQKQIKDAQKQYEKIKSDYRELSEKVQSLKSVKWELDRLEISLQSATKRIDRM